MPRTLKGDLIELALAGSFDVIVHGCNCFCTMGAGIAKSIREIFPEAWEADLATTAGDKAKLGTFTMASVKRNGHELTIVNAYTQYGYAGPGRLADYDAVRRVFASLKQNFSGRRFGYPKIGAGLAKGDWNMIRNIIDEELDGENHVLVEYQGLKS